MSYGSQTGREIAGKTGQLYTEQSAAALAGVLEKYTQKAFARVAFGVNANVDSSPFTEALSSPLWSRSLSGSGDSSAIQFSGGVARASTGVTASSVSEVLRGFTVGTPGRYPPFFGTAQKFYCAARFAINAIDAFAACVVSGRGDVTGNYVWQMGGVGPSSIAKFVAKVNNGSPSTLVSTISLDVNVFHTHEFWSDGVTSYYSVDDEVPQSAVKLPDEQSVFSFSARNGVTLTNRTTDVDWFVAVSDGQ